MTQKNFALQRVFLKDLSFESPMEAQAFTLELKPEINVDLHSENKQLDEKHLQVALCVTITAKQDEKTVFIAEVDYAGIFIAEGFSEEEKKHLTSVHCPTILFPYVREQLDSVIVKGNFPALLLAPLNFEAIFRDAQEKEKQSLKTESSTAH